VCKGKKIEVVLSTWDFPKKSDVYKYICMMYSGVREFVVGPSIPLSE
jgi:hypothetical protein